MRLSLALRPRSVAAAPRLPRSRVDASLAAGALLLERAGIETARLDAECLLAEVLGCARWELVLAPSRPVGAEALGRYLALLARRERREPMAYVLGRREFWSLSLTVSPDVLVPRPETETLVEATLALADRARDLLIVELCTGSGAVAVALARELPAAHLVATDVSARALRVAAANAAAHGVAERIRFARGSLWTAVDGAVRPGAADLVVANPPYVATADLPGLMPELQWEPRLALDGGPDGLRLIRDILSATPRRLVPGGHLLLEIGADQGPEVVRLAGAAGLEVVRVVRDLGGRDRVVVARRRPDTGPIG
jgi:release factor glutamine methyltransferase